MAFSQELESKMTDGRVARKVTELDSGWASLKIAKRSLKYPWIRPVQSTAFKLGQCSSQPLNFVGVCYFFSFSLFLYRAICPAWDLRCYWTCLVPSLTKWSASKQQWMVHWPPMNKFACKLHRYILYLGQCQLALLDLLDFLLCFFKIQHTNTHWFLHYHCPAI